MKKDKRTREEPDRHLDVPAEANRDKHVNFVAQEQGDTDPSAETKDGRLIKSREKKERQRK